MVYDYVKQTVSDNLANNKKKYFEMLSEWTGPSLVSSTLVNINAYNNRKIVVTLFIVNMK